MIKEIFKRKPKNFDKDFEYILCPHCKTKLLPAMYAREKVYHYGGGVIGHTGYYEPACHHLYCKTCDYQYYPLDKKIEDAYVKLATSYLKKYF